jgi:small subunit ribosomal protein S17
MAELGDAAPEQTPGDGADAAGEATVPATAGTAGAPTAGASTPAAPAAPAKAGARPKSQLDVDADESGRRARKVREGLVVSDKMQSTVVVAVTERVRHAKYGKTVQRTKRLYAHDDHFEARIGDRVRVAETRPVSKLKRWRVTEVLERAR